MWNKHYKTPFLGYNFLYNNKIAFNIRKKTTNKLVIFLKLFDIILIFIFFFKIKNVFSRLNYLKRK